MFSLSEIMDYESNIKNETLNCDRDELSPRRLCMLTIIHLTLPQIKF